MQMLKSDYMGDWGMSAAFDPKHSLSPEERRAYLKRKGKLKMSEAAEYLEMSPKTLRNRVSMARKAGYEGEAPRFSRLGDHGRLCFQVTELDAWLKKNTTRS